MSNPGTGESLFAVCFPEDYQTGIVAGFPTGKIFKTTDAGQTWYDVTPSPSYAIWSLCFPEGLDTGYAAGGTGASQQPKVLKTEDGGETWTELDFGFWGTLYDIETGADLDHIWVTGDCGVVHSSDGGQTWSLQFHISNEPMGGCDFLDNETGYAVGGFTNAMIVKTTDGGINWDVTHPGGSYMGDVLFPAGPDTGFATGIGGRIFRTVNGGDDWSRVDDGIGDGLHSLCFPAGCSTGYVTGTGGHILKTTDAGETWEDQATPTGTEMVCVNFPPGDVMHGYVVGLNDILLSTGDGGGSTGIADDPFIVIQNEDFGIGAWPSPSATSVTVRFRLPQTGEISIEVYGLDGRLRRTLSSGEYSEGTHEILWDGRDADGRNLSGGMYLLILSHPAGMVSETVIRL
ncbi:MAG: hypothetical protein GF388_05110 [Candidatus Aegiribacteria sp.]|nr:hypothetical protein [Candidatus Aegiribacteria sp.]MBD3294595.1 hypothetical protein [Candidatus Fermentibacteria bacterium]